MQSFPPDVKEVFQIVKFICEGLLTVICHDMMPEIMTKRPVVERRLYLKKVFPGSTRNSHKTYYFPSSSCPKAFLTPLPPEKQVQESAERLKVSP
jgi:hypothetical protein